MKASRILQGIVELGGRLSEWLVIAMGLVVFAEAFSRYALRRPLMVGDEIGAYLLIAVSYLGGAFAWKARAHVRVSFLAVKLPRKAASWLRLVTKFIIFLFMAGLSWASYSYLGLSFKMGQHSNTVLRIPLQIPQMALPIGFTIMTLLVAADVVRAVAKVKAGECAEEELR